MQGAPQSGKVLSTVVHGLLCATGFLGVSRAVRPLVPLPEEYGLAEKLEYFSEHKDDYDAVFLGSSHVWRSVIPELFDQEAKLRGHEVRSFNFGVGGMRAWESDYLVHRILDLRPERLRWLFVEGGDWEAGFPSEENRYTSRTVYWHDLEQTLKVLPAVWCEERPLGARLLDCVTHVQLWLWRLSNYGQGRQVLLSWLGRSELDFGRERTSGAYLEGEGFQTQESLMHPEFVRNQAGFEADVARIPELNAAAVDLERVDLRALKRRQEAAKAAGVELITVVLPLVTGAPVERTLHERGELPLLFDFNRPDRFPELFRPQTRFSPDHLNLTGARELTRLLARGFSRHLRGLDVE